MISAVMEKGRTSMSDYIKREDALCVIREAYINMDMPSVPSADVVERPHGKWEELPRSENMLNVELFRCSNCGKLNIVKGNYCYICGARMDGDDK